MLWAAVENELTFKRLLLPAAALDPDRPALRDVDVPGCPTDTLGDHASRSLRIASALRKMTCLSQFDRVAVLAGNSRLCANLYHASMLRGAIINPLNTRLAASGISYILRHSDSRLLFADGAHMDRLADIKAAGGTSSVEVLVGLDEEACDREADLSIDGLVVAQIAVIGIPSETWGEAVHTIVVLRADAGAVTEQDIITYACAAIAAYKVPKSIEIRSEAPPLSDTMKALKRELRKPYWEDRA